MADSETITCNFTHWYGTPAFVISLTGSELKRVLGAVYAERLGLWFFPAYFPYAEDVVNDLKIVVPNIEFTPEAQKQMQKIQDIKERLKKFDISYREGFKFATKPYKHQEEAVKFMLALRRAAIFYDMGLGKTKAVIDVMRHDPMKTLVLAPLIGVNLWVEEIKTHTISGELETAALIGTPKKKKKILEECADADVLITSYDTAKRYNDNILENYKFERIVADESHYLRGHRSARTKSAVALASHAHTRIILSGTPSLGNPLHLWGQLSFLANHIPATNFWKFKNRYCMTSKNYRIPGNRRRNMIVGYKNLDLLNSKVQRIALRKKKEECLDLPERTITDIEFSISGKQKKAYNELVETSSAMLDSGKLLEAANAAVVIQKLMQVLSGFVIQTAPDICDGCKNLKTCVNNNQRPYTKGCVVNPEPYPQTIERFKTNPKMDALEELLDGITAEERNKCIIWAWFTEELNMLEEMLKDKEIQYLRLDGRNSSCGREYADKFNADPNIKIWLAQVSTGVALTLNAATYMIYYNLSYDLGHYLQSLDRNLRIGQNNNVTVYRLIHKNSVLEYVAKVLSQKENIASSLADAVSCILCKKSLVCLVKGIKPYKKGCLHKERTHRIVTHPMTL